MRIDIISIFCEYFEPLQLSLVGRAITAGILDVRLHDLRQFAHDRHRTVDDAPYGGGPGMVMRPDPWGAALAAVLGAPSGTAGVTSALGSEPESGGSTPVPPPPQSEHRLIFPTPSGRPFTQKLAADWSTAAHLSFACGRYEGIDARVPRWAADTCFGGQRVLVEEVSIGDYVLAGGEAAVLVMIETVARLVPGVLGNEASHMDDSFAAGEMERLLEAPAFTRPPVWNGLEVPAVLLSGDHAAVWTWRRQQAFERTAAMRPDLLSSWATSPPYGRLDGLPASGPATGEPRTR